MENKYRKWITRPLIQSDGFSGTRRLCAMLVNGMSVAVRAALAAPALVVAIPIIGVNRAAAKLRKGASNPFKLLLCSLLTTVACAVNGTIVALAAWVAVNAVQLLPTVLETPTVIVAIALLAAIAVVLVKVAISLFRTLLCTATEEQEEPAVEPAVEPVMQSVVEKEEDEEGAGAEGEEEVEDLPFCQLFNISTEMVLLVDHVEMLPDETAFIRVVDEDGYTPLYKRRVRRDKEDKRYIAFNGEKLYLAPEKTKPTVNRKEKH